MNDDTARLDTFKRILKNYEKDPNVWNQLNSLSSEQRVALARNVTSSDALIAKVEVINDVLRIWKRPYNVYNFYEYPIIDD